MTKRHLEDEALLKLLDGELPEPAASAYRMHMEACWTCRTRLEELENAIGEYVRYRDAIRPLVPEPPVPWNDLRSRFTEYDRAIENPQVTSAPIGRAPGDGPTLKRRFKLFMRPVPWLAAAAIFVFVLVRRFENVATVSASELLRKASAAERPAGSSRRIQIKTRARTFTRAASIPAESTSFDKALDKDRGQDLEQMFKRAHFSWEQPLSARSFAVWREQLPEKRDAVPVMGDSEDVIQTSTSAGELRRATLTLRARDLQPVSETLEFATETVDISEAPDTETAAVPAAPAPVIMQVPTSDPLASLFHRELLVFSALHRIGADLGEPVDVASDGGRLIVSGTSLAAARKQQIQESIVGIPGVEVHFEDATGNQRTGSLPGDRISPVTAPPQLRLQTLLGGRESVEDFINRVLDGSDAVMARAHALRTLSRTFSPVVESSLAAGDRDVLASLRNDHTAALTTRLDELRAVLQPILGPQSPADQSNAPRSSPGISGNWQAAEQPLFDAAKDLDQMLNRTLAASKSDAQDNDFERVAAAIRRVQTHLERFQRVTGTKP